MMTRTGTVPTSRMILIACGNAKRISRVMEDILSSCSYNVKTDDFEGNTDFVIYVCADGSHIPDGLIPEVVVFDEANRIEENCLESFKYKITSYECYSRYYHEEMTEKSTSFITYSPDNYSADITCRNLCNSDNMAMFDVIANGILSRVHISRDDYTVEDVLLCTAALTAEGMPLDSVLGYFNSDP
ncbi:MAG: hypothetical protein II711_00350 [Clostridia bacterium]|nr:hypothetical protein [Clostridia bacterium]